MNNINHSVVFNVSPHEVFEALMDEKKHAAFTGSGAKIEWKVGGKFRVWDGYATGETLELIPDKKIVQTWRVSDWSKDAVSTVTFLLTKTDRGTKLTFTHEDVPEEFVKDIEQGWKDFYWKPMQKFFEKSV